MKLQRGRQSLLLDHPVYIRGRGSIVGKKEGEGPLGKLFDQVIEDPLFAMETWEEAESKFLRTAGELAIKKAGLSSEQIRYAFAGDLLGQLIATSFGMAPLHIPLFGLYGACANIGSALSLGAMTVCAGYADHVLALASSHFGSAEKQFRYPLEYGNQKPLSSTYTVTGSGAFVLSKEKPEPEPDTKQIKPVKITGITTGKIVDYGVRDAQNMGGAMAPAASHVIYQSFRDFSMSVRDYDKVVTGDLGEIGQTILLKLLKDNGLDISEIHLDCGMEIFDKEKQDTHCGGSGCACSASVLAAYLLKKLEEGEWKRVLFVPTGALFSTVSFNEGKPVPGIAHGIILERED
ncbi:MAG: stage V sporulation protein AD [Lachnospiraceae bacterium]|nr:stage V sporulation protein AD [Lachnospiraceae bacterium]